MHLSFAFPLIRNNYRIALQFLWVTFDLNWDVHCSVRFRWSTSISPGYIPFHLSSVANALNSLNILPFECGKFFVCNLGKWKMLANCHNEWEVHFNGLQSSISQFSCWVSSSDWLKGRFAVPCVVIPVFCSTDTWKAN